MKTAVICEKCVKTAVICGKWVKTAVICGKCVKTAVIRREYMKAAIFWRKLVKTHLSRSKYVKASRICRKTAKKILSAVKPDARNQPVLSLGLTTASDSPAHSAVGGAARVVPSHFLSHRADFYNAVCPYRWHPVPDVCNGKCPAWSWEVGGSVNLSHFFTSHLWRIQLLLMRREGWIFNNSGTILTWIHWSEALLLGPLKPPSENWRHRCIYLSPLTYALSTSSLYSMSWVSIWRMWLERSFSSLLRHSLLSRAEFNLALSSLTYR